MSLAIEGTWEEILGHADELAGDRLRVTVLDQDERHAERRAEERRAAMLAWLERRRRTPLTEEEEKVLDDFEEFRKQHPFRLRRLDLEE